MLTWQVILLVAAGLVGLLLFCEMLSYRLTDIYFQAKLDYMNRLIGGLAKAAASVMEQQKKEEKTDDEV